MKHYLLLIFLLLVFFLLAACYQTDVVSNTDIKDKGKTVWPEIYQAAKPWARWWWMGSAVDKSNLEYLLNEYKEAGIGGLEIAPIYGAKGYEDRYIEFLSPQWLEMLDFTVKKANDLGMGIDMTMGTGWPFGGPKITPENAASKMIVQKYKLQGGQTLEVPLAPDDPKQVDSDLLAVIAYGQKGEIFDITEKVEPDKTLEWIPENGVWEIYAVFNGKTRQMVKRAAPGGEGFTLDHLSKDAVNFYLNNFDNAFGSKNYGLRSFYNDSYEVYGADWTSDFFNEFETRRGYDLRFYLKEFLSEDTIDLVARVKSDYRETMSDILLENFTKQWSDWANKKNSLTRNQAHGSPGNLLDLYGAVDIPEGETFGSSYFPIPGLRRDSSDIRNVDPDPIMLKFAASAANFYGKPLVSSETFTWLTEHFKTSYSQAKPEVEQVFLSGINHVIYHGITYSPQDVPWPGWLFYASLNLTPANSLWPHMKGMNEYIARCQSILQEGTTDNELAIYWPVYDYWNKPEGKEKMLTIHAIDEWLHPTSFYKQAKHLMEIGYSLDFVSDKMLQKMKVTQKELRTSESTAKYQILIIPKAKYIPLATLQHILMLSNEGATVIMEALPEDVPGLGNLEENRRDFKKLISTLSFSDSGQGYNIAKNGKGQVVLAKNIEKALEAQEVHRERLVDTGLKFIRRAFNDGKYYYLVNHTGEAIATQIPLNFHAESVLILDPQSGAYGSASYSIGQDKTNVSVQLQPGEALILKALHKPQDVIPWQYLQNPGEPFEVKGIWNLKFTNGGPALPGDQKLEELVSWTELPDEKAHSFSGSGIYTININIPEKDAQEYVLELGKVNESAKVWINGEEAGIIWSFPFQARVGRFLKTGMNTIQIEVVNLMANRIRDMDRRGLEWRKYHEINFVNIDYKPFDASEWMSMPGGLLGPVRIIPYHSEKRARMEIDQ